MSREIEFRVKRPMSQETKDKISKKHSRQVFFDCDFCGKQSSDKPSHYARKIKHFCSRACYSGHTKSLHFTEQRTYKGVRKEGESKQVYHKRYCETHRPKMRHHKSTRYAREKGAEGSFSLYEWEELKLKHNNKCACCGKEKSLTKDHIVPLSKGGTNYISNIQPLCRSCNSRKNNKDTNYIHQNPELL